MNLNIGSGLDIIDNYINIDKYIKHKKIINIDVEELLPYANNSIKDIKCSHVLEHLNNVYQLLNEINRIQESGGKLIVKTPIFCNLPQHRSFYIGRNWIRQLYNEKKDNNPVSGNYELILFEKKGFGFINVLKRVIDRFIDWINSFLYEEYVWILRKK